MNTMKRILLFCIIVLSSACLLSCTKGSNEGNGNAENGDTITEDVYFVKYASDGLSGRYDASYTDENGRQVSLQSIAGETFERTVGPVKKGFKATFSITRDYTQAAVRIETKKNDEPFLVKKESTYGSVSYTIE